MSAGASTRTGTRGACEGADFAALGNDPYLIGATFGTQVEAVASDGDARLVMSRGGEAPCLHGIGEPAALGALVARVLKEPDCPVAAGDWVWLTPGAAEAGGLVADDDAAEGERRLRGLWGDWVWMGFTGPAPRLDGDADKRVELLDPQADADEIAACLERANPDASLRPGEPDLRRWWGYRLEGELLGVIADAQHGPERLYELHSLGTVPEARGHGVGGALLRRSVADQLQTNDELGYRIAILGVYAGNTLALRWYERFGFSTPYPRQTFEVV